MTPAENTHRPILVTSEKTDSTTMVGHSETSQYLSKGTTIIFQVPWLGFGNFRPVKKVLAPVFSSQKNS